MWAPVLLLGLATFLTYLPALRYPFVSLDDVDYVTENRHVQQGLSFTTVTWAVSSTEASNWHPLTWMSHALDCALFGLDARGHHLTNLLFHIANSILLLFLLIRGTGAKWRSVLVAWLFALHPMNVESVAWIAERKTVLSMFFFLLTIGAYGWYARKPGFQRFAVVFALSVLALSAKPMVVTLPFVLLLLDIWPLGRVNAHFFSDGPSHTREIATVQFSLRQLLIEKLPLFALSAASCVITLIAQRTALKSMQAIPLGERCANALFSYLMYLVKAFWPSRLSVYYAPMGERLAVWEVLLCGAPLIVFTLAAGWKFRRLPFVLVGWLWFLGTLVPMIGIIQVGEQGMADRYAYLPYVGLFVLIVWGLAEIHVEGRVGATSIQAVAATVLLVFAVLTWRQVHTWKNSYALWFHSLEITPENWAAEDALGSIVMDEDRRAAGLSCSDRAMAHFQNAVRIYSGDALGHINLGFCQQSRRQFAAGIENFEAALVSARTNTLRERAYLDLGAAYDDQGLLEKAHDYFAQGLQIAPNDSHLRYALAKVQAEEKVVDLSHAVSEHPTSLQYLQMGELQAELGRIPEAKASLASALHLNPELSEARSVLNSIAQAELSH